MSDSGRRGHQDLHIYLSFIFAQSCCSAMSGGGAVYRQWQPQDSGDHGGGGDVQSLGDGAQFQAASAVS